MIVFMKFWSWLAHSSMFWEISFLFSFCWSDSNFGMNFVYTLLMNKSSVIIDWTDPWLIPTSATIFSIATRWSSQTFLQTFAIILSFLLVRGLPQHGSLSTEVQPSLNQLYHSFICDFPLHHLLGRLGLSITKSLAKFDSIFAQCAQSSCLKKKNHTPNSSCLYQCTTAGDWHHLQTQKIFAHA